MAVPLVLRLEVAGFTAIDAVIEAILAESDIVLTLAQAAKLVTNTAGFVLLALETNIFVSHCSRAACRAQQL